MKKIIFLIIIILLLLVGLVNKTFFSQKYLILNENNNVVYLPIPKFSFFLKEENNEIRLFTLKKESEINKFITNYISNLESCYDNSYHYDVNRFITIQNYSYENNIITIKYFKDNICKKEHELSSNWSSKFNNAEYKYIKYNNKDIEKTKYIEFINSFNNYDSYQYNNDITIDDKYHLKAEFISNNKTYIVDITHYKKGYILMKISCDNKFQAAKFYTGSENILELYFKN
jgi:hypothetical protein